MEQSATSTSDKDCTCPKNCDCQNPPPFHWDGQDGIYHISNMCPIHNENPLASEDCPVHNNNL